ncbi:MAG: hypothetical protein ABIR56_18900 [Polaromonas sp.]
MKVEFKRYQRKYQQKEKCPCLWRFWHVAPDGKHQHQRCLIPSNKFRRVVVLPQINLPSASPCTSSGPAIG